MFWADNSTNPSLLELPSSSSPTQSPNLFKDSASTVRTIAFVDSHVADFENVLANIKSDVTVLLDPTKDGVGQITDVLGHYQNLTGVEIVSHGNVAEVQLGNSSLSSNSLSQHANELQQWNKSLASGADILLYGCYIAAGAAGQTFIQDISSLTGADVAASNNLTGNATKGGDWQLEYATGKIETATPFTSSFINTYQGSLQSIFTTQTPDNPNQSDGTGAAGDYELGMEFVSTKAGKIDAIRYYKAPSETGTHTGRIWSITGSLLGTVDFTNETASGWQQQALATPLNITANTTYVVSVNVNSYFAVSGGGTTITNGDLSAVADGSNGVINATPGLFPTASNNSNYFRDIVFTPNTIVTPPTNQPGTIATSGTTTQNQILTATVTDADGLTGVTINYKWQQSADGNTWTDIAGATSKTLTLSQAQVNQKIRTNATYTDALGSSENILSLATASVANVNDLGTVAVSGTTAQNQVLTANVADLDGLTGVNVNYKWQQSTNGTTWVDIAGATAKTLTLSQAQVNQIVRANAVYTDVLGSNENVLSAATAVITAGSIANRPGTITVSGTTAQNQTLTANVADADGLTGVTIDYKWQQSTDGTTWNNIAGATGKTLSLSQAQVNQRVRATATYTDALGASENLLSATTAAIANVNDIGKVILKGSATVGRTLTETVLDEDGLNGVNISYRWQQSTNGTNWSNINGATSKSLDLTSNLLNKQVRVRTTYTDALGARENIFSAGTIITAQNAIVLENQKTGTTDWQIVNTAKANNEIAGYGDASSINKGQALNLKVSLAKAGKYDINVYRLGYYGGAGGRLISSATGLNGVTQAAPTIDPTTRLVECKWNTSYTLQTGADWTSGLYLAKLTDSTTGKQSYVEFVVRDDNRPAEIGFQEANNTVAAYNNYGGYSSYAFNSVNGERAYKVSFDRPLSPTTNGVLAWEYQTASWAEAQGYDISYYANSDVQTNPFQLYSQNAFLSVGHDEYWSMDMRNNVEKARDNGTNLAFFSANSAYWRVRYEPSTTGQANRVLAIYKDDWNLDPIAKLDNSQATTRFRSTQVNRPENALLGVMYVGQTSNVLGGYDFVVSNAADPYYAGTGLKNGDKISGLVGYEWDAVVNNGLTPTGLVVLSASPATPDAGVGPDLPLGTPTNVSNAVRYTAASGAKVFASGSIQWVWGLNGSLTPNPRQSPIAQKIATNVFADLGAKARTPTTL
jgi:Domain of unknown function (DUF4347)/Domain of unknown function (DUF4082)